MYRKKGMDELICITELNDFVFCPASIYFHNLYGGMDNMLMQTAAQINGTSAHKSVDEGYYSNASNVMMGTDIFCEKYGLVGKIDIYDRRKRVLRERKRSIKKIYDGYVFQVYAQCFALREMGYSVEKIELYSMIDNKTYNIQLPENNADMLKKFEKVIYDMRHLSLEQFYQNNQAKCMNCIYEPACDRSLI
jgi:CRISPR-associated protein Cas4